tara:strand:+ start:594 stop:2582 length:1989 start_codon:yes stop_codon:yes gene_type:complete
MNKFIIFDVLLPLPFNQTFQYKYTGKDKIVLGDFVSVPFKNTIVTGCIWEDKSILKVKLPLKKIKYLKKKLNFPPLSKENRDFIDWVSKYTMNKLGQILKLSLSSVKLFEKEFEVKLLNYSKINEIGPKLTNEQKNAKDFIYKKMDENKFCTVVIDGVAGSGKTEVYFEAISKALKEKKQTLVLLPEISMTTQWFKRFKDRFKIKPLVWHSSIKIKEKIQIWNSVINGNHNVIVGARSALFLPFTNLGLIVLDEEHDQSFKQEEGVIYNARDMAVVRAKKSNIPIILSSATLSIETIHNINKKKYFVVNLQKRYGKAGQPQIKVIDLIENPPEKNLWLSNEAHKELNNTLKKGNQALIFLNRRGFAPYVFCNTCGNKLNCPNCDIGLVFHKNIDSLLCHHCGFKTIMPKKKRACDKECNFYLYGPGVERIKDEIENKYKNSKVEILTSDIMSKKKGGETIIKNFENEKIKIIIGTQILAKGHHFPKLTLVIVVDSDIGFFGGDLRAGEKIFQLLMQVAGRSGRSNEKGKVLIQSTATDNFLFKNLVNFKLKEFFSEELKIRKHTNLPPFKKLCLIMITSKNERKLKIFCNTLKNKIISNNNFEVLGPAPPYISFLRKKFRQRFIVRCSPDKNIQEFIKHWMAKVKIPFGIKTYIDIDPYNFS